MKYLYQDVEDYVMSELKPMKMAYHPDMPFDESLRDLVRDGYIFESY